MRASSGCVPAHGLVGCAVACASCPSSLQQTPTTPTHSRDCLGQGAARIIDTRARLRPAPCVRAACNKRQRPLLPAPHAAGGTLPPARPPAGRRARRGSIGTWRARARRRPRRTRPGGATAHFRVTGGPPELWRAAHRIGHGGTTPNEQTNRTARRRAADLRSPWSSRTPRAPS